MNCTYNSSKPSSSSFFLDLKTINDPAAPDFIMNSSNSDFVRGSFSVFSAIEFVLFLLSLEILKFALINKIIKLSQYLKCYYFLMNRRR